jgi:signal transduction histidine kinase
MNRGEIGPAKVDGVHRLRWTQYVLAVLLVIAATEVGRELEPVWAISGRHPYLIAWPTIMLAAWIGGLGPGLVANFLSTIAIAFYWIEPTRSLHVQRFGDFLALAIFAGCGAGVSMLTEWLHRARRRVERARDARQAMLAIVAHDLRNPLSSIVLASQWLRLRPEDLRWRLETIDRATARIEHLIRDLVDASVLDNDGNLSITLRDERVDSIVTDAVVAATVLAAAKAITIDRDVAADVSAMHCDRERVLQVLGNLLGNAIKFTPEGAVGLW